MTSRAKTLRERVEARAAVALLPYAATGTAVPIWDQTFARLDALIAELGYEDDPTLPVSHEVEDRV